VRSEPVVFVPTILDQDLRLEERVEEFAIQLVAQPPVEGLGGRKNWLSLEALKAATAPLCSIQSYSARSAPWSAASPWFLGECAMKACPRMRHSLKCTGTGGRALINLVARLSQRIVSAKEYGDEFQTLRIGRGERNDLRFADSSLSRSHAVITNDEGIYELRDLGSRCGTYVNGVRVTRWTLNEGDVLAVGRHLVTVSFEGAKPPVVEDLEETLRKAGSQPRAAVSRVRPGTAHAWLSEDGSGEPIQLTADAFTIGSASDSDLSLAGGVLSRVPRRLALIVRGRGGHSLLSFAKQPKTVRVNGAPLSGRCWLETGDTLRFARRILTFYEGQPNPEEPNGS
jgi:pSer/pThr/pTyr-binding forkhead associated (FHA) protein